MDRANKSGFALKSDRKKILLKNVGKVIKDHRRYCILCEMEKSLMKGDIDILYQTK